MLNASIVAEGVEQQQQLEILAVAGCDLYQGYLFSPAVPCLEFEGLLKPVIVDLTYDYLLTKKWHMFSSIPIKEFLESFNRQAKKRSNDLPTQASELVANLADEDRLNKYHDLNQLKKAFERIDTRLSCKTDFDSRKFGEQRDI